MSKSQEELTFDCLHNVVEEFELNDECPSILEEIRRCRQLYDQRQELKRNKAIDIRPLYHEHRRKRDLVAKYPVYKTFITEPRATSKKHDPDCHHVGQVILDRDILTKFEHISFLAQPKANFGRLTKPSREIRQKRFLPNCTTRVETLAHPKTIRVKHNWQDFHKILSVRQSTNLRRSLQKLPLEYTTIENAITYIHEERRLKNIMKNESLRRCEKIKKKLQKIERKQMGRIILAMWELTKEFLMNDKFIIDSSELSNLSRVLESKITKFTEYDKTTTTSHIQRLLKTVAGNLANWMEEFTSNCGFGSSKVERTSERNMEDSCKPFEHQEQTLLLPVDDYISYHSPSTTSEDFADAEEYDGEVENEGEIE